MNVNFFWNVFIFSSVNQSWYLLFGFAVNSQYTCIYDVWPVWRYDELGLALWGVARTGFWRLHRHEQNFKTTKSETKVFHDVVDHRFREVGVLKWTFADSQKSLPFYTWTLSSVKFHFTEMSTCSIWLKVKSTFNRISDIWIICLIAHKTKILSDILPNERDFYRLIIWSIKSIVIQICIKNKNTKPT